MLKLLKKKFYGVFNMLILNVKFKGWTKWDNTCKKMCSAKCGFGQGTRRPQVHHPQLVGLVCVCVSVYARACRKSSLKILQCKHF